jgi:hypothetical protein
MSMVSIGITKMIIHSSDISNAKWIRLGGKMFLINSKLITNIFETSKIKFAFDLKFPFIHISSKKIVHFRYYNFHSGYFDEEWAYGSCSALCGALNIQYESPSEQSLNNLLMNGDAD